MTTSYIRDLFDIFNDINKEVDKSKLELLIAKFIGLSFDNIKEIKNIFIKNKERDPLINDKLLINGIEYNNKNQDELIDLDELFKNDYSNIRETTDNNLIKFAVLIERINDILSNGNIKEYINYNQNSFKEFNNEIDKQFDITNAQILRQVKEIYNVEQKDKKYKDELTTLYISQIFNSNRDKFEEQINEFIRRIDGLIKKYNDKYDELLDKIKINPDSNLIKNNKYFTEKTVKDFLNNDFNKFIKNIKLYIKKKLNSNEFIKKLYNDFKKEFKYPELKEVIEDLEKKYKDFRENVYENKEFNDTKKLLKYDELFNTKNGEWINDSKRDENIRKYKKRYDELLSKLKPEKIEVNEKYNELYNFSEKIKEIKVKLEKKEKLQETEVSFVKNFDKYIEIIKNNPEYNSDEDFKQQIRNVEEAFRSINIKDRVEKEIENKRVIKDVISKEEKEFDKETYYFEDYIQFFKIALKIFTYGGILFAFIVLFISILGLLILLYDIIYNTIKLLINSANSTNNLSLDYISKSIIKCNKNNYDNDRFLILTEQKQNLSIFNLGAYTLYILITYFIAYIMLVFYTNQMRFKFVGSLYDIDINFVYLFMIVFLLIYSFIHLIIFKLIFKPYVYIPYKTIDNEEIEIDKMISNYINVKTNDNKIIRFDDFFELLYDASKIDDLSEYFLKQIKNEDDEGCLEQKIIIYNLYEYLRQYVNFDEDFKWNFKHYCSTDENNKPIYENGGTITFISMLKNDEVKIISNYHEELDFINKLEDDNIEFYNKLNKEVSNKIKNINKKIITHNKTTLPFFITIIYMILIFLLNLIAVYFIIKMVLNDKTDAYHEYIKLASTYLDDYVYKIILKLNK
jgi:hypothetical protein